MNQFDCFSPPRNTDYRAIIEDIPSGCSWQDLKDHFRSAGDVCFADIRRDRNGRDYGVVGKPILLLQRLTL